MSGLRLVVLGLSITSSWGNGHATTWRGLTRALVRLGHDVSFLERDLPWYAAHRDALPPEFGRIALYADRYDLQTRFAATVSRADAVIVGSFVPDGARVLRWVLDVARGPVAFYDIDTPVTMAKLRRGDEEYVAADLLPALDLYLSFTGGPLLDEIRRAHGVARTAPLYCSVDPAVHHPVPTRIRWDLGYLGTYSADRQPRLEDLLLQPARLLPEQRFVVAGPQYPEAIAWPANVARMDHVPPHRHAAFYSAQRYTLNVTRADMVTAGWSPSVRLFEAAACGVAIVSDRWPGLETVFALDDEILVADTAADAVAILSGLSEAERSRLVEAARTRVLSAHTALARARELERLIASVCRPTTAPTGFDRPRSTATALGH